jgi:molybdenum cofactor synthesis domain-containing protein
MDAALVTVGDELLAGDTTDTNATWLADQLTDRGVVVRRVLTVPDDEAVIADAVREYSDAFDAVIVTGGLGGTPDDVTMDAVARAFDRPLVPDAIAREDVERTLAAFLEENPELELDVDVDAEASIPAEARPILNPAGLSPGCVIENVYVLPGIPEEMEAVFGEVADEFAGDVRSSTLYTTDPEANMIDTLREARERFDVAVGCYPDRDARHNRLKVSDSDPEAVEAAVGYLRERVTTVAADEGRDREDTVGDS